MTHNTNKTLLTWFRKSVYLGAVVHFLPSVLWFRESYTPTAFRETLYGRHLHAWVGQGPTFVALFAIVLVVTGFGLVLGKRYRRGHWCTLAGLYVLISINSFHTNSLAVQALFGVLFALALFDAEPRDSIEQQTVRLRYSRIAIVAYLAASIAAAGFEKLGIGWVAHNEMYMHLTSPPGYITHSWVHTWATTFPIAAWWLGKILSLLVMVLQWSLALLLLVPRLRVYGFALTCLFFGSIIALFQVPFLFLFLYIPGIALAVDWDNIRTNIGK